MHFFFLEETINVFRQREPYVQQPPPPIFLEFYVPLPTPFYCIFKKEFLEIFEIWSFMSGHFFRKITQNFPKSSEILQLFFKIEKTNIFCTQISPKSLY